MIKAAKNPFAFAAIPLWLGLSLGLPFIAMFAHALLPRMVAIFAFFAPSYLFSFSQVVRPTGYSFIPLFTPHAAIVFGTILWASVTLGYGFVSSRWQVRTIILAAPVVILIVCVLTHIGFAQFGYKVQLDGP